MTDQEILEKHSETIENDVTEICKENHIEDDSFKESILHTYQKGFLKGFKKGKVGDEKEKAHIAKELIIEGMALEKVCKVTKLNIETVKKLAVAELWRPLTNMRNLSPVQAQTKHCHPSKEMSEAVLCRTS